MRYRRSAGRREQNKKWVETMKLEEMELARARIDLMIDFLQKKVKDGANGHIAEDIARYQRWRDDLNVQIGLERIRRSTHRRRRRTGRRGQGENCCHKAHRVTASLLSASHYQ
jgi:hypothetical protein